jgi:predicted transcriptional regulator
MGNRPSYSSVRALMRILEEKGHLKHASEGSKYVYSPTRSHREASKSALQGLLRTFFDGSAERAVAALLEASDSGLTKDELKRLAALIDKARKEGR